MIVGYQLMHCRSPLAMQRLHARQLMRVFVRVPRVLQEIESLADFEITERRADAQEWIAAWRERTSVKVMA